jgi:hypothetical protein
MLIVKFSQMKKHLLIIPCFLLSATVSYTQTARSGLEISIGPAFPISQFASKHSNKYGSGLAANGQQVNVTYLYKLHRKFSLSASLYAQRNPLDRDALTSESGEQNTNTVSFYSSTVIIPFATPGGPATYGKNWVFEKHAWMAASLLLGGEGELPLSNNGNFSFIPKAMIGIIGVKSPKLEGRNVTDTSVSYASQNSVSAVGLSYLVRTGVSYHLKKNISIVMAIDYLGTNNITFKKVKSTLATAGSGNLGVPTYSESVTTRDARQTFQSVNINAGIRLSL